MARKILVLALGNDLRGDDVAGFIVADELEKRIPSHLKEYIDIVKSLNSGVKLLDYFTMDYDYILVVDSIIGDDVGDIKKFNIEDFPQYPSLSLHQMGIPEILSIINRFKKSLPKTEIYCVVIKNVKLGSNADERVVDAARRLAALLARRLESLL